MRRLLVPVDGSPLGEHAIPLALHVAGLSGAQIDLVYVHLTLDPPFHGSRKRLYDAYDAMLKRPKEEYLSELGARISRITSVPVNERVVDGRNVLGVLREHAEAADLAVISTRARRSLGRLTLGSVAARLVQETTTPLLLVRGSNNHVDLAAPQSLRHALASLDGTPGSEAILKPLAALGRLDVDEMTLLRVLPIPRYSSVLRTCFAVTEHAAEQHDAAMLDLLRLADGMRRRVSHINAEAVFSDNSPAQEILLQAGARQVDLIAVATHRRTGVRRLLGGGVADALVRKAKAPVLVVSRPEPWPRQEGHY
jgi:nucleotide-binding universal stress UspA family protein